MTDRLIEPGTGVAPTDPSPYQADGTSIVERPGEHGPLSGSTGAGPQDPATPGKAEVEGQGSGLFGEAEVV